METTVVVLVVAQVEAEMVEIKEGTIRDAIGMDQDDKSLIIATCFLWSMMFVTIHVTCLWFM